MADKTQTKTQTVYPFPKVVRGLFLAIRQAQWEKAKAEGKKCYNGILVNPLISAIKAELAGKSKAGYCRIANPEQVINAKAQDNRGKDLEVGAQSALRKLSLQSDTPIVIRPIKGGVQVYLKEEAVTESKATVNILDKASF